MGHLTAGTCQGQLTSLCGLSSDHTSPSPNSWVGFGCQPLTSFRLQSRKPGATLPCTRPESTVSPVISPGLLTCPSYFLLCLQPSPLSTSTVILRTHSEILHPNLTTVFLPTMALIALPTRWNVDRVVFLAENLDSWGPTLHPLTRSPDRCERAYPVGLWVAAGPDKPVGRRPAGRAWPADSSPSCRPSLEPPCLESSLVLRQKLLFSPPCLGLSGLGEVLGRN